MKDNGEIYAKELVQRVIFRGLERENSANTKCLKVEKDGTLKPLIAIGDHLFTSIIFFDERRIVMKIYESIADVIRTIKANDAQGFIDEVKSLRDQLDTANKSSVMIDRNKKERWMRFRLNEKFGQIELVALIFVDPSKGEENVDWSFRTKLSFLITEMTMLYSGVYDKRVVKEKFGPFNLV